MLSTKEAPAAAPAVTGPRHPGTVRAASCTMPATAESAPALRRFAADTARRWSLAAWLAEDICLAVAELVANAVLHSGSPDVSVLITASPTTVSVRVKDRGEWRQRSKAELMEDTATRGRGLHIVDAVAGGCCVVLTREGTLVVAEWDVPTRVRTRRPE